MGWRGRRIRRTRPAKLVSRHEERGKNLSPRQYTKGVRGGKAATWHSGTWRKGFWFRSAAEDPRGSTEPRGAEAARPPERKRRGAAAPGAEAGSGAAAGDPAGKGRRPGGGSRGPGQERGTGGLAGREGKGGPGERRPGRGRRGPRWRPASHLQSGHGAGEEVLAVLQLLEVGGPRLPQRRGLPLRRHLPLQPGRQPRPPAPT